MISALQMRNGDMSGELPFPEPHSWEVERAELWALVKNEELGI